MRNVLGYVERLFDGFVEGWAFGGDERSPLIVRINDIEIAADPEWIPRPDVVAAHPQANENSGFRVAVPEEVRRFAFCTGSLGIGVRVGDHWLPPADSWMKDPRLGAQLPVREQRAAGRGRLFQGLTASRKHKPADTPAAAAYRLAGFELQIPSAEVGSDPVEVFHPEVGEWRRLVEAPVDVPESRVFEIPVVQRGDGGTGLASLLLRSRGRGTWEESFTESALVAAIETMARVGAGRQGLSLLAIEHAATLKETVELSGVAGHWLVTTARKFKCDDMLFSLRFGPALQQTDPALQRIEQARKRLERECLEDCEDPGPVIDAISREVLTTVEERLEFAKFFAPALFRRRRTEVVAELLGQDAAGDLLRQGNATSTCIALPLLALDRDIERICRSLRSLAQQPGWILTEAILESSRLCSDGRIDAWKKAAFVESLVAYLDAVRVSYWSRAFDRDMIRSLTLWIRPDTGLDAEATRNLQRAAARIYAMNRDFWLELHATYPDRTDLPHPLKDARDAWQTLSSLSPSRSLRLDESEPALAALAELLLIENADALWMARSLLRPEVSSATPSRGFADVIRAMVRRADSTIGLRETAHPGTALLGPSDALKDEIRHALEFGGKTRRRFPAHDALFRRVGTGLLDLRTGDAPPEAAIESIARAAHQIASTNYPIFAADCLLSLDRLVPRDLQGETSLLEAAEGCFREYLGTWDGERIDASLIPVLHRISRLHGLAPEVYLASALAEAHREDERPAVDREILQRLGDTLPLPGSESFDMKGNDTLVVLYSCRAYLESRVGKIRATWLKELEALGIPYLIVVGGGDDTVHGDVLGLDVSDDYEALPAKTLALFRWLYERTTAQFVIKIDDDCVMAPREYFSSLAYRRHHYFGKVIPRQIGSMDRRWHREKSRNLIDRNRLDRTPEPASYCDGGGSYSLSRHAIGRLIAAASTREGKWLANVAMMEDKLVGDLLALNGIRPSSEGFILHTLRRTRSGGLPVPMYDSTFMCSASTPTMVAHLDDADRIPPAWAAANRPGLSPRKIWPSHERARMDFNSPQVSVLSSRFEIPDGRSPVVVCVVRNEIAMLPHFLAHYRRLGVAGFHFVDNLSDDGTTEYLLEQSDCVVCSTDCQYSASHYGVAWQEAVLSNHYAGRWALLVDCDEFLSAASLPGGALEDLLASAAGERADCIGARLIDVYPKGELSVFDPMAVAPWDADLHCDEPPVYRTRGTGYFSNSSRLYGSSLRRRLNPEASADLFVANKCPLVRYQPWMRLGEGIHHIGNVQFSTTELDLLHVKYHAGFSARVATEVRRGEHFNGAVEYKAYARMLEENGGTFFLEGRSRPVQF
jgi:hypothetical protein